MRVVNPEKVRMKAIILNDLKSNETNLNAVRDELQDTIAIICNLVGGSVVGIDQELIGYCQRARSALEQANQRISYARDLAEQLDVTEEA